MIATWKELENEIEKVLRERQRVGSTMFHRFYDTASAGNYLPAQPADFLAVHNGRAYFIEAKFSEVHETLKSCFSGAVKPNQTASAHLVKRAGAEYVFLFYSRAIDHYELWDGEYCFQQRSRGERLHLSKRRVFTSLENTILGGVFNGSGYSLHRSSSWVKEEG